VDIFASTEGLAPWSYLAVYCAGTKLYNAVPTNIEILNHDIKAFVPEVKVYIPAQSFSSAEALFYCRLISSAHITK
jgi:hypothetical protein